MVMLTIATLFIQYMFVKGLSEVTFVYRKGSIGGSLNMSIPLSGNINWHGCARVCQGQAGCAGFCYKQYEGCRLCYNKQDGNSNQTQWDFWAQVIQGKKTEKTSDQERRKLKVGKGGEKDKENASIAPTAKLSFTTALPQMSVEEECDEEGFNFLFHMCIKFYERQFLAKTWIKASIFCQEQGARLIKLNTRDKMKQIRQYIQSDEKLRTSTFYIGAHDVDGNGRWQWEDGYILTAFDYQREGLAPGGGRCMNLKEHYGHHWNKGDCNYPQGFICERDDIV